MIERPEVQEDLSSMTKSGTFAETSYPKLLANLYGSKETGILHIYRQKGGPYKQIYFRGGKPVCIRGTYIIEKECLGQLLKFSHKISDWDLNNSLKIMQETKQYQGEVFVREGTLTKQTLNSALKWQADLKLAEVFTWKPGEGHFEFYSLGTFKRDKDPIEIDIPSLLLKGVKRGFPAQSIEAILRPNMDKYVVKKTKAPFTPDDFMLQLPEERLWEEVIDGDRTLKEVIDEARMDPDQVKRLVYIFEITEMVEFRDKPAGGTDEDKLLEDLKTRLGLSEKGTFFDALGIYWGGVGHTVEEGWEKVQREYGPDSKIRQNEHPQIKKMCESLIKFGKVAYEAIKESRARIEYRNSIFNETKLELSGDLAYQQAESQLLMKEDYRGALANIEMAAELQPRNMLIRAAHGCAMVKRFYPSEPERYREGEKIIRSALVGGANSDMVHFYAGHAFWTLGRITSARDEFEMAVRLNPGNHDARKAIRAMSK